MKKLLITGLFIASLLLVGCGYKVSSDKNCYEPENPYGEGGHYAGFEWARDTGGYCDGNSQSFNNGCEEYYYQLEKYKNCLK